MEAREGRDVAVTRRLGLRQPSATAAHQPVASVGILTPSSAQVCVYIDLTETASTYLYFFLAAFTASCSASSELNVSAS